MISSQPVKASVLYGVKDLRVDSISLPPPGPSDLQINIRSTTLCGSDLHYYKYYRLGDIPVTSPLALGHESSGIVTIVGNSVADKWSVGDRVALEVGLPCENCDSCKGGRYNICTGMRFRSSAKPTPHFWGTLQETINHPAKWCHKSYSMSSIASRLPPNVSYATASLIEPLSVAIHSTRRTLRNGSLAPGSTVLVIGAGAVGLLVSAMAKLSGASRTIITDTNQGRVDFAVGLGFATQGFVRTQPPIRIETIEETLATARETAANICKAVERGESGVDVTFECTGAEVCVQTGIYATRPGGTLLLIGMGDPIQTLPISAAALREVDILGGFRYANTYPTGIEIVAKGLIPNLEKVVTHTYVGLDQVGSAFGMASRQRDGDGNLVIKVECAFPGRSR